MRIRIYLAGLIITVFTICSCEKEKAREIEIDIFTISYSKGSSWVDYSYNVTIGHNGLMEATEINGLTNINRKSEYQLIDSELIRIKENLNSIINTDVSDQYGFDNENAPTDLPITILNYKKRTKSDSTSIYYPKENELPFELVSFLQTIEQVILDNDTLIND